MPADEMAEGRSAAPRHTAMQIDARFAGLPGDVVDPVSFDVAAEAMSSYAGFDQHPFPGCFACGTERPPPDGLGLRPGRPDCVATTWVPDASLASEVSEVSGVSGDGAALVEAVWAALDCPGDRPRRGLTRPRRGKC